LACVVLFSSVLCDVRFFGQSVLVTGGSSGIGREVAKHFARECASTIHIVARSAGQLASAKSEIEQVDRAVCLYLQQTRNATNFQATPTVISHVVDMTNLTQVKDMFSQIPDIDAAVNAAGIIGYWGDLQDVPSDVWLGPHDAVHNNIYATMFAIQGEVRHFLANNKTKAAIVNLSSYMGLSGMKSGAMYSASKHAIIGLTKSVAIEVGAKGIRVNAVAPGLIETPLTWNLARHELRPALQAYQCTDDNGTVITADYTCDEDCPCPNIGRFNPLVEPIRKTYNLFCPMGRLGEPQDIAKTVLYLASEDASYVTGVVVSVDGGAKAA
jgi:NAD(P)-dependent dehydrogenase (short-subunit alcohol dehydrogenase family)